MYFFRGIGIFQHIPQVIWFVIEYLVSTIIRLKDAKNRNHKLVLGHLNLNDSKNKKFKKEASQPKSLSHWSDWTFNLVVSIYKLK